jgi:ELWxxDGT repeat protein
MTNDGNRLFGRLGAGILAGYLMGTVAVQAAAPGVVQVKDINPGASQGFPFWLTNVNGTLFFVACDVASGCELWKSDGTAAGTVLVKDIYLGGYSSHLSALTNVNGTLFFVADDGMSGYELWKSNGTTAGTVQVKDIVPGVEGSVGGGDHRG